MTDGQGVKTLIIGRGEVGTALVEVLDGYSPVVIDKGQESDLPKFDVMHICFPFSAEFVDAVYDYRKRYQPRVTVIHSTVPVGTSRQCNAVHSPVRGEYPYLASGIRMFTKMIGGKQASAVADYFRRAGLRVHLFDAQETTELAELCGAEYYRTCAEFAQRVKVLCGQHGLSFHEVYTLPNTSYNEGQASLGNHEYIRPILQPIETPIGSHLAVPE